jgi:hypothetical protein
VSVVYLSDIKKAKERKALNPHARRVDPRDRRLPSFDMASRAAALMQPRDLTAILMGDPPPGRSALDKRA